MNLIPNIIFDLGGVLLNIDFKVTQDAFKKFIPDLDPQTFYGGPQQLELYNRYETGITNRLEFLNEFRDYYRVHISEEEFKKAWNAMLFDFPENRKALLKTLRDSGKRIFLLSNTNEMHIEHIGNLHPMFDKVYYSHEIHLRKPNAEIFQYVLNENKISPNTTLFIDDTLMHVEGAKKVGIEAFYLKRPLKVEELNLL